ncbi:unnamed protein product [Rotaria magnacalcarata]|uniref:Uncharacterized protein n=1 Tax=Rotaria magnacalcarata TaxID=392030 RepID=A0A816HEI3_9BILA|nr:unnamed protein product [Rotaria magnacalcarata]CAF3754082.1 unnamed protein product [Rotaria magnacalcarata]CAF4009791.1 unnamed protein product [Rotaria magnacalcarata]
MKKTKVCIIDAGTAGVSAAWSLTRYPNKFDVIVYAKKKSQAGGVATTEKSDSSSCRNSTLLHRQVDFDPSPVQMCTSFGQNSHA